MYRYIKSIIFILFILGAHAVAPAQLRYGFRFGGMFSDPAHGLVRSSGFSGGMDLEYQFPKCGFAPDIAILYTRYNRYNTIEVPLHLKYKFWIAKTHDLFAPMIFTGPSMMCRLGSSSPSKVIQPGWDAGIGFDIINFIQITAGYRFGLGNASKVPGTSYRTNGWTVAATILFDF